MLKKTGNILWINPKTDFYKFYKTVPQKVDPKTKKTKLCKIKTNHTKYVN